MFNEKISDLRIYEIAILLVHEFSTGLSCTQVQEIIKNGFEQEYPIEKIKLGTVQLINLGLLTREWPGFQDTFLLSQLGLSVISRIKKVVDNHDSRLRVIYTNKHFVTM